MSTVCRILSKRHILLWKLKSSIEAPRGTLLRMIKQPRMILKYEILHAYWREVELESLMKKVSRIKLKTMTVSDEFRMQHFTKATRI